MLFCAGADPYVYIRCEGRKRYRSHSCKDTTSPEWNFSTVIYRRQPIRKPIVVQVRLTTRLCISRYFVRKWCVKYSQSVSSFNDLVSVCGAEALICVGLNCN